MPTFTEVADRARELIAKHRNFHSGNLARADWRNLVSGSGPVRVILSHGGMMDTPRPAQMSERWSINWIINIEIWVPYRGDFPGMSAEAEREVQLLMEQLLQYPTLDSMDGVIGSAPAGSMAPQEVWVGATGWWKYTLPWGVKTRVAITNQEVT